MLDYSTILIEIAQQMKGYRTDVLQHKMLNAREKAQRMRYLCEALIEQTAIMESQYERKVPE